MTPKQEAFVREYLKDLNGAQAAIRAGYSERTARAIACELLTKPDMQAAVAAAQLEAAGKAEMTVDQHLADLKRIRDAAFDDGKYAAAATAEMGRGRVAGFYVEKVLVAATVEGSVSLDLSGATPDQLRALAALKLPETDAPG